MFKNITVMSLAVFALISCGKSMQEGTDATVAVESEPSVVLVPVDSIGVEQGDSNYVMGGVESVAFGPDGNIAVLDCGRSCTRIYSREGEYLRRIGNRGNGPGELQSVTFLAISEDGHVYMSGTGSSEYGVHAFDYFTGRWLESEHTFVPPSCLEGSEENSYVRKTIGFEMKDGEPWLLISIARHAVGLEEPIQTYYEESVRFDLSDDVGMLELDWYGYDIAATADGDVYIAPRSTEEALVIAFDSIGQEKYRFELDLEPVARTEDEMEMERNILRAKAIASDENPAGLEPNPYKPLIRGLEVDGSGNLWVLQGGPSIPTFNVFDSSGEFLYTARVAGNPPDGSTWRFYMDENGILAYAEDPASGFQKIYMLEMQ
ncbi:MAG: hypothetical protein K8R76_02300 [Candidatus Aegiribacteria sp.]|nr:hypothetical protein [Candidatus Aegiribacteria sp.]